MQVVRVLGLTLRLHFRNRMAVIYGHLFPLVFLFAYLGLYATDNPPLLRHFGELLTITALSGACFALPTTIVRDRERGVWRRYSLAPASVRRVVAATLLAHFCLLGLASATQLVVALMLGMPVPSHFLELCLAFCFVAFAFIGLGLMLSGLANTVIGSQALGQCVFLPMLVLGGIAVRVESLPGWARTLSAYLPGRYAVELLQACVSGRGLEGMSFHLLALTAVGATGIAVGASMIGTGAAELVIPLRAKARAAGALAAWLVLGYLATTRGPFVPLDQRIAFGVTPSAADTAGGDTVEIPEQSAESAVVASDTFGPRAAPDSTNLNGAGEPPAADTAPATAQDIDRDIPYAQLPPDDGLVAPIARADEVPPPEVSDQLECMRMMIPGWGPGRVADPTQRVRNYLYVAAVPDIYQTGDLERWVPLLVEERLKAVFEEDELERILYTIAMNPDEGDLAPAGQLNGVCFERGAPSDVAQLRERVMFYALKLLGRTTGRIPVQ